MESFKSNLLILSLSILLLCFASCSKHIDQDRGYIVKVGQMAPDFTLTMIEGKEFRLSDQKGKVVMLQFTASWCGVCRKEMPHIENEIWQPLQNESFTLIGLDRDEPLEVVQKFANTMQITYPLAPDPEGRVFQLYAKEKAGITRNVVIDQEGKIAYLTRLYDETEFEKMKTVIHKLLDK